MIDAVMMLRCRVSEHRKDESGCVYLETIGLSAVFNETWKYGALFRQIDTTSDELHLPASSTSYACEPTISDLPYMI